MNTKIKISIIFLLLFYCTNIYAAPPIKLSDYKLTTITPILEAKIEKEKNLIYCSTFQMAWNKLTNLLEETIEIENAPDYISLLNSSIKNTPYIPEKSYIALAGLKKDKIVEKINIILKKKFKISNFLKDNLKNDLDIIAFAYFKNKLKFKHEFEKNDTPLKFKYGSYEVDIASFGIKKYLYNDPNQQKHLRAKQVEILYWSNGEFVPKGVIIKLNTLSSSDEIIISTLSTESTLKRTYEKIKDIIDDKFEIYIPPYINSNDEFCSFLRNRQIIKVNFRACESLLIPIIKLNVFHSYEEIINKKLLNYKLLRKYNYSEYYFKYIITEALQNINFELDQKGAQINSHSKILVSVLGAKFEAQKLYINEPFIIYLRHKTSELPYFIAYIANDELLEKFQ